MTRPTDPRPCPHSPASLSIDPDTGDVWCYLCSPPRNLTDEWMQACELFTTDFYHPADVAILGGDLSQ